MSPAKFLIGLGLALVIVGLLWPALSRLGLGRLPGDLAFRRGGFTLYIPLATSLIASLVLSVILWLIRR